MKKLLFHLLIFTLFAAAAGCSSGKDDDGNPDVRFYAVPASLNFEAGKTTLQLSISTTGHWTIVCDDEWLEAVPAEGTGSAKVGITAQANPLAQSGNCTPCPRITSTPSISTDPATGHGARSLARQPGVYEMSGIFSGVPCLGRNARQCGSRQ